MAKRIILIFIDGLGWGRPDPAFNPQYVYGGSFFRLPPRGGDDPYEVAANGWATSIDAVLDVPGVPQSATGQTTLLSGVSAQGVLGKHLTGFPNAALREVLLEHSVLRTLTRRGLRAQFLNVFRPRFWELSRERQLTLSATTVSNLAADLPFCTLDDLRSGRAIYQDFTNADLIARGFDVPPLTPVAAGEILAHASRENDFTLYEYFLSDTAGHTGDMAKVVGELNKLDAFLGAVLQSLGADLAADTLVLLTSDHGNLEDISTRRHTTNPVPLMAWGHGARAAVGAATRLDQVTPLIVNTLSG